MKNNVYVSNPSRLRLQNYQLVVECPIEKSVKGTVPIEDMALLLLDHPQISITQPLLQQLQGNNIAVISCDAHHLPLGMMLPLYGHTEHSDRVKHQIGATETLKKQLWKQTVVAKIKNQQALLQLVDRPYARMSHYIDEVKPGDPTNCEAKAAQFYWKNLFDNFKRGRYEGGYNPYLNYGYAILRSMVAREIVATGLLPVLGIFHKNKYNPYTLADDLMEPYRPFVDKLVYNYVHSQSNLPEELTKEARVALLRIATQDVMIDGKQRPLCVALNTTVVSLYKCYTGTLRQLKYPNLD